MTKGKGQNRSNKNGKEKGEKLEQARNIQFKGADFKGAGNTKRHRDKDVLYIGFLEYPTQITVPVYVWACQRASKSRALARQAHESGRSGARKIPLIDISGSNFSSLIGSKLLPARQTHTYT